MSEISDLVMKEYKDKKQAFEQSGSSDNWYMSFFENFHLKFRDSRGESYIEYSFRYLLSNHPEKYSWDKSFREMGMKDEKYSGTHINKTPRQFFQDFEDATTEAGIPSEKILKVNNYLHKKQWAELEELFLPIYIKMREKGYNHHDLIN